ncbi:MAG: hypothetical protein A2W93_13110 [Bacteroidetes bacterium GWF2_43_63]|nr:MAG: hypothetical protein A2W94_03495 [Bacteroidetes bacterium GWE2_42_42]OFY55122.1 MAG: hypothetical protein A2W93_13110 [Bacteroidetes bacterium GWF2_43_63]HBG70259.1 hypothetical protein [Bacteroidales bacterium]HCB63069.1 hypothetical protein [Bacteroidales bacterium]HCY22712.1 hypothetical protein [Bacteroidales bacterium]
MKICKQALLAAIIFLQTVSASAQDQVREGEAQNDTTVILLQKIDDPVSVVLFRNDSYVISASFKLFRTNLAEWINENPGIPGDEKLLELVDKAAINLKIIDAAQIAEKNNLLLRLKYRMADLLQNGQCMIYDKRKYGPIANITVQTYSYDCGPLCGEGGRRFLIEGALIFEVIDWFS